MVMSTSQARVINPILTKVAQGYTHPERVGHVLFPRVPVRQRGGQVIEFGRESFRRYRTRRAPGANTARVQFGYDGKPFGLVQDALEGQVPWEHMEDANQVPGIDMGREATNETMEILSLALEIEQAELALDATRYTTSHKTTLSGTDQWSDSGSDPSGLVRDAKETVRSHVGMRPNVAVISASAFAALTEHPKIVDRVKYTSSDSVTVELLARLWGLRRVAIGEAVYLGDGDTEMTDVWGKHVVLAYVPEQITSRRMPSFGYTYTLHGHPVVEEPYQDRNAKSWMYPVTYERQPVLSGIESGFLIQDAVA